MPATRSEISAFLAKLKPLVADEGFRILDTPKNLAFLTETGLNKAAIKEELLELKVGDYFRGPLPDNKLDRNPHPDGCFLDIQTGVHGMGHVY